MVEWERVTLGCTGAVVRRSPDGTAYAKTATDPHTRRELADERDRVGWLATTDVPGPRLIDWTESEGTATLVTSAVPGIPASAVPATDVRRAIDAVADLLRSLHALPIESCPFDRRLAHTVRAAEMATAAGRVDEDGFDAERSGRTAGELVHLLHAALPAAAAAEPGDQVVCHGDACLPNVLLDPDTLAPTGFVDLGRLGVADRYLDLALVHRSASAPGLNAQYGALAAAALLATYGIADPDEDRLAFYRLLDEFC